MLYSEAERRYLESQFLGRFATTGPDGSPQVRPVGFRLNDDGTIDIGGPNNASSQKYRNAERHPGVSLLVDDMTPNDPNEVKPGWGRGVEIRGTAELVTLDEPVAAPGFFSRETIRIHPKRVISWHIDAEHPELHSRDVGLRAA